MYINTYQPMNFKGIFSAQKPDIKLTPEEEKLTKKVSDTMQHLDDNSIIIVGNPDAKGFNMAVGFRLFETGKEFTPNAHKINNAYIIKNDNNTPMLIAKKSDKQFYIYCDGKNLMNPKNEYRTKFIADLGDVIELNTPNKTRIRLEKSNSGKGDSFDDFVPVKNFHDKEFNRKPIMSFEEYMAEGKKSMLELELKFNAYKRALAKQQYSTQNNGSTGVGNGGYGYAAPAQAQPQDVNNIDKTYDRKDKNIPHRTYADVAGIDESIDEMEEKVLFPIIYPEAFPKTMNKGTILYGEPGTGKTLLVLATIGEAKEKKNKDINFVQIDASSTTKPLVGVSEGIWRDIFKEAKMKQPSIIFVDEIDSVLGKRQEGSNYTHNNAVVTQFLKLMEGLEKDNDDVWVIGATNRLDAIDPAIKRNGRFGNHIEVKRPNKKGCGDIFELYTKKLDIEDFNRDAFYEKLYENHQTGADIATIVENARTNMYKRCGIIQKMKDGTYNKNDLKDLKYIEADFVPIQKDETKKTSKTKKIQGFSNAGTI